MSVRHRGRRPWVGAAAAGVGLLAAGGHAARAQTASTAASTAAATPAVATAPPTDA
jgi:hypothetical protein